MKIKELREKKKWSVSELSRKVPGLSEQMIYSYESGRRQPSALMASKIAEVFDVTVGQLLGEFSEDLTVGQKETESLSWYKSLLDEMREEKRRLQDQVDRLTRMLENQLGKPFDVTLGGLAIRDNYLEAKIVSMESQEVANSVTSLAERA